MCLPVCVMSGEKFVNLHVHTARGSLLDSISKPEDLVKKAKQSNQVAIANTDHGTTYSSVYMYKECKKNSLKFLFGIEAYICDNRFERNKDQRYYHLTILAKNEKGRVNINKLASLASIEGFYHKPRIDFDLLTQYHDGLIVLSGCMASELQQTLAGGKIGMGDIEITSGNVERAKEVVKRYHNLFGSDYYLEVQSHKDKRQQQLNREIVNIAKDFGIEWVATADSHFVNEEDHELHSIFIQISRDQDMYETQEIYADTQLQTEQEARDRLMSLTEEEIDIAIRNTRIISDKCNVIIPLSPPLIPHVEVPQGFKDENDYLKHLCNVGWKRRKMNLRLSTPEAKQLYKDRLYYEFDSISKMGFSGYFLLVHGYANSVKRRGIARGSAGGSLVSYLLNITDVDPIRYGLYFERFIDVGALSLLQEGVIKPEELKIPDVDSDFGSNDRDIVLQSIVEKYGKDRVASLGQFGYIWDKSAIQDIGRVLGVPPEIRNKMTKQLGDDDLEDALHTPMFKKWEQEYPKLFYYAQKIAGLPRSFGSHPCGKVVTIDELNQYSAVSFNEGELVFQMDMKDAESLGLVKVDLLGLKSVDVIYDTLEMIGKDYDYIAPDTLNFEDQSVLDLFRNGETEGVFQFESVGMKNTLIKMIPTGLEDLSAVNALFRPGSLKYIDNYIKRKHGLEQFEYLNEDLRSILDVTYGIVVYQEQLIEIGRLSGMRNPDEIRQATAKKKIEMMAKVEPQMKNGLIENRGWTKEQADKLWDDILAFAKYSFNKSHSVAYAIIAYIMAYLKVYHPKEFMTSLLTSKIGKYDEIAQYINECSRMNINVIPPNINKSISSFSLEDGNIRFGLFAIRGVGQQAVDVILSERQYGKYIDINNFVQRCASDSTSYLYGTKVDSATIIALIKSGAFGYNKDELMLEYAKLTFDHKDFKELRTFPTKKRMYELGLISSDEEFKDKELCLKRYNEFKRMEHEKEQVAKIGKHLETFKSKYIGASSMYEFDTLSYFLTENPFDCVAHTFKKKFHEYEDEKKCIVAGTIAELEYKKQKNGGKYAFMKILTLDGMLEGRIFHSQREQYQNVIFKGSSLVFLAKRSGNQFIVDKIKTLSKWKTEHNIEEKINKEKSLQV